MIDNTISRREILKKSALGLAGVAATPILKRYTALDRSLNTSSRKATVKVWSWYTEDTTAFPKVIAEFEKANPNITIVNRIFGSYENYLPPLEAAVAAGETPDIFAPATLALTYGQGGIALDLAGALGRHFLDGMFTSTYSNASIGGKTYAIGWEAQTFGLFYNPQYFKKAGVKYPDTWDDLIDIAPALRKKAGVIPVALDGAPSDNPPDFFCPLVTQVTNNPNLMLELDEHTKPGISWDSKPVIEALTMVERLTKAGVFEPGCTSVTDVEAAPLFYSGKTAMLALGSWIPAELATQAPKSFNEIYKVGRTPAWKSGARHWCSNQSGALWSVSAKSKYAEEAIKFLKFLYEPARYAQIMNETNSMPATYGAVRLITNPMIKQMTSWLVEGDGCAHNLMGVGSEDAVGAGVQQVLNGTKTPKEAAAYIEQQVVSARKR